MKEDISPLDTKKSPAAPVFIGLFLLIATATTGIRADHVVLAVAMSVCFYANRESRKLITGLAVYIIYWLIFDSMKAWPNYSFHSVDILPLYSAEKELFGINYNGIILTPNEFFALHANTGLDILCAAFYLSWIPLPLVFAIYLYFKNRKMFLRFSFAFFIVNIIGFIIYYVHPAAPPWYIAEFGHDLITGTRSYAAGLLRVDEFLGINLFQGIYAKGSNVFAAMPSLHASYPLIGFIYALKQRSRIFCVVFGIVACGIWFSAIYLSHHYILDVLAGIACGLCGIFVLENILLKRNWFENFFNKYFRLIS